MKVLGVVSRTHQPVPYKAPIKKQCHGSGGLATRLQQRSPGLNPRTAHVVFVMFIVASAQVFLLSVSCGRHHSTNAPYSFVRLSPMLYDFSTLNNDSKNRAA